jgi:hypothetical protein
MLTLLLLFVILVLVATIIVIVKREAIKTFISNKWQQFKSWIVETFWNKIFHKNS